MQDRINQVEETSCTARPDHTDGSNRRRRSDNSRSRPLPGWPGNPPKRASRAADPRAALGCCRGRHPGSAPSAATKSAKNTMAFPRDRSLFQVQNPVWGQNSSEVARAASQNRPPHHVPRRPAAREIAGSLSKQFYRSHPSTAAVGLNGIEGNVGPKLQRVVHSQLHSQSVVQRK
jgi:hypothetical protein